jgi:uncharacterized protein GlcG (DUF336 family)
VNESWLTFPVFASFF